MTDPRKKSRMRTLGFVATAIGMCFWAAHMILKYAMHQPENILLLAGVVFIIAGFVIRRTQT